jgi:transcriptional regulator with XRE-family HTH domain
MISEKIKYIRNDLNLNQKDFANLLNVAQSTVSRIEKAERQPEYEFLRNFIIKFNINPDWIFFDVEPAFLDIDDNNITMQNQQLIKDIDLILTPEEFNIKLNEILFEDAIKRIASDDKEKSPIRKFLEAIKLDTHIPFRPLLFLYYIFRYVRDNNEELNVLKSDKSEKPYQTYLLDLVRRYSVLSFKNNPAFTSQIKKQFEASISMHLEEEDCKRLITHYEQVIKNIESKMTPMIVLAHRKIDTKTLFPKQK